jgi:hypothetical protein
LSRDPINEEGGLNLYGFVENEPIKKIDPFGLFFWGCSVDPCKDPCGDVLKKDSTIATQAYGFVACCNGKKFSCLAPLGKKRSNNPKAQELIAFCIKLHEDLHHHKIDCTKGGVYRGDFKSGIDGNAEHCIVYEVQLNCLETSKSACGGDLKCVGDIDAEKARVTLQKRLACAEAGL